MSANPGASDWIAARGEKWAAQLSRMEPTLRPVDEPLLHALRLDAPFRIAEVGCGGGGTALEISRQAPVGSVVHGFDISPGLIDLARRRPQPDARAISFEVADMATAAPEEAYDRLVSRFGVMFFDDPRAAFANLSRWLRPGGRFAFAVWGPPSDNLWMTRVRDVVAQIIDVPGTNPEAPGPFRYAEADKLLALLEGAGLGELELRDWRGALPLGGGLPPEEAARFSLSAFGSFSEQLADAGEGALDEARRALTTCLSGYQQDGAVVMDARVHIVTGARP